MTDMIDGQDIERIVHAPTADERLETVMLLSAGLDRVHITAAARDQMISILRRFADDAERVVRDAVPDEVAGGRRQAQSELAALAAE